MSFSHPLVHQHVAAKKKQTLFDKVIIVSAFIYPLSGISQVVEVFRGNTAGVSAWSWMGFMGFSILFLIYGIKNNVRPMMITNSIWIIVDGLIIIGVLAHSVAI